MCFRHPIDVSERRKRWVNFVSPPPEPMISVIGSASPVTTLSISRVASEKSCPRIAAARHVPDLEALSRELGQRPAAVLSSRGHKLVWRTSHGVALVCRMHPRFACGAPKFVEAALKNSRDTGWTRPAQGPEHGFSKNRVKSSRGLLVIEPTEGFCPSLSGSGIFVRPRGNKEGGP